MKPNCYDCRHRREIPGDCHSRCEHPRVGELNPLSALLSLLGKRIKGPCSGLSDLQKSLGVTGNPHGAKNGWFCWPYNFDPVWLESCAGFEARKESDHEK